MVPVPFEGEDHVDHVLEDLGAGDGALGDVADEHNWKLEWLGGEDEFRCGLRTQPPNRARLTRGVCRVWMESTKSRSGSCSLTADDALRGGLWQHEQFGAEGAKAVGPKAHLFRAFLSGHVEHLPAAFMAVCRLRVTSDAGLTTEKDEGTRHEPTAQTLNSPSPVPTRAEVCSV